MTPLRRQLAVRVVNRVMRETIFVTLGMLFAVVLTLIAWKVISGSGDGESAIQWRPVAGPVIVVLTGTEADGLAAKDPTTGWPLMVKPGEKVLVECLPPCVFTLFEPPAGVSVWDLYNGIYKHVRHQGPLTQDIWGERGNHGVPQYVRGTAWETLFRFPECTLRGEVVVIMGDMDTATCSQLAHFWKNGKREWFAHMLNESGTPQPVKIFLADTSSYWWKEHTEGRNVPVGEMYPWDEPGSRRVDAYEARPNNAVKFRITVLTQVEGN